MIIVYTVAILIAWSIGDKYMAQQRELEYLRAQQLGKHQSKG